MIPQQKGSVSMETKYLRSYSPALGRDMESMIYGHGGKPVLVIPSQNGRFFDWANFEMTDNLADYIESGRIQLLSVDTIDQETVSQKDGDPYYRIRRHEAWYRYVMEEALPQFLAENGSGQRPLVTGVSMGAYHAGNFYFRRPDVFDSLIALSGVYDCHEMYGGYMDGLVYENSPADFLANMPADHPWIQHYNENKACICVGQGAWEDQLLEGTRRLDGVLKSKGITGVWVDYWGYDVNHDWPWWRKQMRYFLPHVLGDW
jgi:esterase/lipase superfamily enzyme